MLSITIYDMILRKRVIVFALCIITSTAFSQSTLVPLFNSFNYSIDRNNSAKDSSLHTSVKPYIYSEIKNNKLVDSLYKPVSLSNNNAFFLSPITDVQFGSGTGRSSLMEYTGGLTLTGCFGKKWSASVTGLAGNMQMINYLDSSAKYSNVIPNFGYAYKNGNAYSFQSLSGYISYSPNRIFNFQIGKDKHFWGDGYRSLFLSDYSNNYPFVKLTANIWKIKYVSLFAWQKDVTNPSGLMTDAKNKFGTFHLLSWNATKRINISLFESIVWQGSDSSRVRSFDVNYMNPVIFYRPVEYSLGSSDNALIGAGFKVKLFKKQQVYGQVILDEFLLKEVMARKGWWANKQGVQLGYKFFDLFNITNLYLQAEFNYVRPYTYSHGSVQQNYGHFNQPLAHPLGANFSESVGIINYQYKKWSLQGKLIIAVYGLDTSSASYGKNIFVSYNNRLKDYGNTVAQGLTTNLFYAQFTLSYLIKAQYNLRLEAGLINRSETNTLHKTNTSLVYIGIKTSLYNTYRDF
jgi:hypothetical protein